jgi:hypothetical protein
MTRTVKSVREVARVGAVACICVAVAGCSSDGDPPPAESAGAANGASGSAGSGGSSGGGTCEGHSGDGAFIYEETQPAPCSMRVMAPDASGHVTCTIFEALPSGSDCAAPGRGPMCAVAGVDVASEVGAGVVCELQQLSGDALTACKHEVEEPAGAPGWCYLDADLGASGGNPALVAECPDTGKRRFRFVGMGALPREGGKMYIFCTG